MRTDTFLTDLTRENDRLEGSYLADLEAMRDLRRFYGFTPGSSLYPSSRIYSELPSRSRSRRDRYSGHEIPLNRDRSMSYSAYGNAQSQRKSEQDSIRSDSVGYDPRSGSLFSYVESSQTYIDEAGDRGSTHTSVFSSQKPNRGQQVSQNAARGKLRNGRDLQEEGLGWNNRTSYESRAAQAHDGEAFIPVSPASQDISNPVGHTLVDRSDASEIPWCIFCHPEDPRAGIHPAPSHLAFYMMQNSTSVRLSKVGTCNTHTTKMRALAGEIREGNIGEFQRDDGEKIVCRLPRSALAR